MFFFNYASHFMLLFGEFFLSFWDQTKMPPEKTVVPVNKLVLYLWHIISNRRTGCFLCL